VRAQPLMLPHTRSVPGEASLTSAPSFDAAFGALFTSRFEGFYRYLHNLTGDGELADDVAQEAFVRLYDRGTMPDAPAAWLVSVAHNLVRDEYRREERQRRLGVIWQGPVEKGVEDQLLASERAATVHRALGLLKGRQRRLLLLRNAGYSYDEIAQAMHIAPGSIGTLLVRATRAFVSAYRKVSHASD
jgi:RNA polymerase sigma-70 factor, ECF subfamily